MAFFTATLTTAAGSTTLPPCALIGGTGARLALRELGVFNTTVTEVDLILARITTAGTPGASATTRELDEANAIASVGILKNTYTSTAPTTADLGIGFMLGAAKGSGIVLTWEPRELVVAATASHGVCLLVGSGTGQALRVYAKWQEL